MPQGSCLSPACYARYTDDIPTTDGVELGLFADDAAFIASSININHAALKMQRTLDALPAWLSAWKLTVNVSKTQAIAITQKHLPPKLKLLENEIEWAPTVKYLGVTIDRNLTMGSHTTNVCNEVRAARALLRPMLRSHISLRAKIGIYKTYLRSRLTYAAPAWFALVSETNRARLRAQQAQSLRAIVNAPRYVRNATIKKKSNQNIFISDHGSIIC